MKYKSRTLKQVSSVTLLSVLLPLCAFAEESQPTETPVASTEPAKLEEFVVTARKRTEKLQDVPLSISTVSGKDIGKDGDYSIQNLAEKVPNLLITPSNPRQTGIAIRGLGKNSANDGLETSVGVYVDGVYLSQPGQTAFDLADLDQVEVLRGPQGTLFGKNNVGGVLNITTLKPSFNNSTKLEAISGNYGTYELHGTTTGAITDSVAFRLTAYDKKRDGFLTNLFNGERVNGFNRDGVRGQLLLLPTDNLTLRAIVEHYETSEFGAGGSVLWNPRITYANGALAPFSKTTPGKSIPLGYNPVFNPWARVISVNNTTPTETHQDAASLQATWNIGKFTLDSITAYRHYTFENLGDGDSTPLDVTKFGGTRSSNDQFSQELRLSSPTGEQFEYVTGLYYYHDDLWSDTHNQAGSKYAAYNNKVLTNPNTLTGLRADTIGEPVVDSFAAFAQGNFHISDSWTATGGLRVTREHKSADIVNSASGGADPSTLNAADLAQRNSYAPTGSASASLTESALSWTGSLSYKVDENINTYATASKGFKSGGINVEVITGPLVVAPETAFDYEAGVKSQWFSNRLQLNANVYNEKIHNYQGTFTYDVTPTTTANYISNVGDVRVQGLEIEAKAHPIDSLQLGAGASYNEATYLNFTNAGCPPEYGNIAGKICNFSGKQLPFAPRVTANVSAQFKHYLDYGLTGYVGGSTFYRSSQNVNSSLSEYGVQKAYAVTNLQAGVTGKIKNVEYDWSVWARNLFDKQYLTSLGGSATLTAGLGDPRTLGTTLRVSF